MIKSNTQSNIVITRIFDASPDLVFKAWTNPDCLKHWWGPKNFTTPFFTVDFRVGGIFRYCMRSADGKDFWGRGLYKEIIVPEKIVYLDGFTDEEGNLVSAKHYGLSSDWPLETLVTLTFVSDQGKTKFALEHANMILGKERDMTEAGWGEMLDRLEDYLVDGLMGKRI
ncbi:MAG: SRPBCC domain-containing protein [Alphaproteobacteria bacterium]|nr:SRPBCC domain-containing protein [Alphaproteobacteria bacterium]